MSVRFRERLDFISDASAVSFSVVSDEARKERTEQNVLLTRFKELRRDLIDRRMRQVSAAFSHQRIDTEIVHDDVQFDANGLRAYRSSTTLRVYNSACSDDKLRYIPHFSVLWDEVNAVVRFYRNSTTRMVLGESGLDGKTHLQNLTSDLIETKLLAFTAWLSNGWSGTEIVGGGFRFGVGVGNPALSTIRR